MLKKCPECELNVSDKALTCPHCGYPLSDTPRPSNKQKRNRRRRRLPNGFGQISEIKGKNLEKPFRVMVTTGKDSQGKPIVKMLKPTAYFKTYNEAYEALLKYRSDPYDVRENVSMDDLFELWITDYADKVIGARTLYCARHAWSYCEQIHNIDVRAFRRRHITMLFENPYKTVDQERIAPSANIVKRMKSILNMVCDHGTKLDLMERNYAKEVSIEVSSSYKSHISFDSSELKILWENAAMDGGIRMMLINCYMGWRPSEMLKIKLSDIDLSSMIITGGSKTAAGMNRKVPIHSKIRDLVVAFYKDAIGNNCTWLFGSPVDKDRHLCYEAYNKRFKSIVRQHQLNPAHRLHDCRKTFVTLAKNAHVDEYALKRIVGHAITDITEKTYTDRPISWLCEEIEKI